MGVRTIGDGTLLSASHSVRRKNLIVLVSLPGGQRACDYLAEGAVAGLLDEQGAVVEVVDADGEVVDLGLGVDLAVDGDGGGGRASDLRRALGRVAGGEVADGRAGAGGVEDISGGGPVESGGECRAEGVGVMPAEVAFDLGVEDEDLSGRGHGRHQGRGGEQDGA